MQCPPKCNNHGCVCVCAHDATYLVHWHAGSHGGHTSPGSPPAGRVGACLHSRMAGQDMRMNTNANTVTHTRTHSVELWGKKHRVKAFYSTSLPLQLSRNMTFKTPASLSLFWQLQQPHFLKEKIENNCDRKCVGVRKTIHKYSRSEVNNVPSAYCHFNRRKKNIR